MVEHVALVVPAGVELVFSFTLAVGSGNDKKLWLLVLDGLTFFVLALTDFLAHVIPSSSSSVHVFSVVDTFLAATSFLPLLFYTMFLFLFARTSLLATLPTRFSRIVSVALVASIPATLATNELSSLLGLIHIAVSVPNHPPIVEVGFSTAFRQHTSLFFAAACLVLLTLFQALLFMITFVRIARGFVEERRIETARRDDPDGREEIHLFRGIGWLAVGLKLGAIETVVGFANMSFGVVVTRRILRLFARGTLIVGVLKGMNMVEDISSLESALRARTSRRSKGPSRRVVISNPRTSTYQELSPEASTFHAAQAAKREKRGRTGPSPLAIGGYSNMARFNDVEDAASKFDSSASYSPIFNVARSSIKSNQQRVTVHYDGKTPPMLQLRFSAVDIDMHPLPHSLYDKQNIFFTQDDKKGRLQAVPEDPREDLNAVPGWDARPPYASLSAQPLGRASLVAPSFTSDVAVSFRDAPPDSDTPRSSLQTTRSNILSPPSDPSPSQESPTHPSPSQASPINPPSPLSPYAATTTTRSVRRSERSARTASAASLASDSLDIVREIAARFPGLPPRVVATGKRTGAAGDSATNGAAGGSPMGAPLGLAEDADSDAEWRELARERSLRRRREMAEHARKEEEERVQQTHQTQQMQVPGVSPVNSIKRKPAPAVDRDEKRTDDAAVSELTVFTPLIAPTAPTVRAPSRASNHASSIDDPPSCYSSTDDDDDDDENEGGRNVIPAALATPGSATTATTRTATTVITPGLWTPGTPTTPRTPAGWLGKDERALGGGALAAGLTKGRALGAFGRGDEVSAYGRVEAMEDVRLSSRHAEMQEMRDMQQQMQQVQQQKQRPQQPEMQQKQQKLQPPQNQAQTQARSHSQSQPQPPHPYSQSQSQPSQSQSQSQPPQSKSQSQPPQSQSQSQSQPHRHRHRHRHHPATTSEETLEDDASENDEQHRLRRLTLLRRELRAALEPQRQHQVPAASSAAVASAPASSAPASSASTASARAAPARAPRQHKDPLAQLQLQRIDSPGTTTTTMRDAMPAAALHHHAADTYGDGDRDGADVVLDDTWRRRAGLARIKSLSRVRVHLTPRVEQGYDVRGSLVAVEEEDEGEIQEPDVGEVEDGGVGAKQAGAGTGLRRSASMLRKPARKDSGVLGEEDRTLIQLENH